MTVTDATVASIASSSSMSLIDPAVVAKKLPKKDSKPGKITLKKTIFKKTDVKDGDIDTNITRSASPDSPLVNDIDPELRATFPTGRPMEDPLELITCKHCKKSMPKSTAVEHIELCLQKKQERARKKKEAKERAKESKDKSEDKDGDIPMEESALTTKAGGDGADGAPSEKIVKTAKESAGKATTDDTPAGPKKGKKRKAADEEGEKEPKKKKAKKDDPPKPKMPKPKGPVDVEKQCGVPLANGAYCARSLTCKSHSMGAKRAVPGRSLPYDLLLAAYQKKNQAKQQKAAIDANAPLADDFETSGPVDSDEEKDAVMAAIARSRPKPLEQHLFVSVKRKYTYVRMKEMLGNALGGSRGGGLFGSAGGGGEGIGKTGGDGTTTVLSPVGVAAGGEGDSSRRSSLMMQAVGVPGRGVGVGGLAPPSRKASTASTATQ